MIKRNARTWFTLGFLGLLIISGVIWVFETDQVKINEQPYLDWKLDNYFTPPQKSDQHVQHDWIIRGSDAHGVYWCKDHQVKFRPSLSVTQMFGIYYRRMKRCEGRKS